MDSGGHLVEEVARARAQDCYYEVRRIMCVCRGPPRLFMAAARERHGVWCPELRRVAERALNWFCPACVSMRSCLEAARLVTSGTVRMGGFVVD